jgi:hypothetical protein
MPFICVIEFWQCDTIGQEYLVMLTMVMNTVRAPGTMLGILSV